jgi:hypothetical protein
MPIRIGINMEIRIRVQIGIVGGHDYKGILYFRTVD